MIDLFSEEMRRDPYPVYEKLRSTSRLLHDSRSDLWMLLDYESVKLSLYDHGSFSSRAAPPGGQPLDWLIFLDPPRHSKLRALIQRAFTPRMIAGLGPRIQQLCHELLDPLIERGEMDLCADFACPLPLLVIAQMIGIPAADRPTFKRWSEVIMRLSDTIGGGEEAATAAREASAVKVEMRAYLVGLLAERRAAPKDDLLTSLAEAEVDGERLSEDEILGFFQLLLVAGNETTTNLITNAMLCLLENPAALEHLRAAPELLPSAIEEVLRYRSPVQAVFRKTLRDVEVGGEVIPAGKLVLAMIGSANRDPRHFQDAGRFDIRRDPNPHLAFGHGIHFCLGASLSRLEAKIALPDLLSRLEGVELAGNEPWKPQKAFHVHGPVSLPICFKPGRRATVEG